MTTLTQSHHLSRFGILALSLFMILLLATLSTGCSDDDDDDTPPEFADYTVVNIEGGDGFEQRLQEVLILADPKTIIQLPAGTYPMAGELSVSVDSIVIRGTGMDAETGTVLNFLNQASGSQGVLATGDNFVIEDLALEDSPGDLIKIKDSNGVTIRRIRAEWTNGPDENNGAYALYPVGTRNVLIEDCEVRGASDAGIYVGQSEIIIVRRNYVYENVAGIEIENSKFADVYENNATANTGGILVFDLPGPPVQGGERTRVFNNTVVANNTPNFAPDGNIVGDVPGGTGIMVLANDDIEIFGNTIHDNDSVAVLIVSYYFIDPDVDKPTYDPIPEKIYLHDNDIEGNGNAPQEDAKLIALLFGGDMVDVFYDTSGVGLDTTGQDPELILEFPDGLTEDQRICVLNNAPDTRVGQANASVILHEVAGGSPEYWDVSEDLEDYNCTHASLPPIELEDVNDNPDGGEEANTELLCNAPGTGINADAYVADCPNLSSYRLFVDPADPTGAANGGVPYDLTTPLFTDYAEKYRYVFIPEGATAAYRQDFSFDFPVGTIISKTFTVKSDHRDPNSAEDIIETRLLIRRNEGWTALPYIWNEAQTDAVLTVVGGTQSISWIDEDGESRQTDYVVPNTNNCANCHGEDLMIPIGPKARLLNKDYPYSGGSENQITYWSDLGILDGAPADPQTIDTIPAWDDTNASLDDRARGYLDINCAHCHAPVGAADTSGLWLEYTRAFGTAVGKCKPPVAAGAGAGDFDFDIVPGNASASIMTFRMNSNEADIAMAEIGRSIIHTEGFGLITDWINAMPADDCSGL